jgi:hypothetical protein
MCRPFDSWTGLPSLSVDVGVDRHQRTEQAGEIIPLQSLPHRRRRQKNQAAEEPHYTGKT